MRIPTRRLLTALTALTLAASLLPVASRPVAARDGWELVTIANRYRDDAGVGPVRLKAAIDQIAVERGNQLAAARQLGHDFDYVIARLAQEGVCWEQLGEIVAWNTASASERLERFMSQWYNSAPHREIMLSRGFRRAGVGVRRASHACYVTADFASRR